MFQGDSPLPVMRTIRLHVPLATAASMRFWTPRKLTCFGWSAWSEGSLTRSESVWVRLAPCSASRASALCISFRSASLSSRFPLTMVSSGCGLSVVRGEEVWRCSALTCTFFSSKFFTARFPRFPVAPVTATVLCVGWERTPRSHKAGKKATQPIMKDSRAIFLSRASQSPRVFLLSSCGKCRGRLSTRRRDNQSRKKSLAWCTTKRYTQRHNTPSTHATRHTTQPSTRTLASNTKCAHKPQPALGCRILVRPTHRALLDSLCVYWRKDIAQQRRINAVRNGSKGKRCTVHLRNSSKHPPFKFTFLMSQALETAQQRQEQLQMQYELIMQNNKSKPYDWRTDWKIKRDEERERKQAETAAK